MAKVEEFGKLVLIEDSLCVCAKYVINYAVPKNTNGLHVLCLEKSAEKWQSVFSNFKTTTYLNKEEIINIVERGTIDTIFIDSINQLAVQSSWEYLLNFIDKLHKNPRIKKIIMVLHNDCLIYGKKMVDHLRYMVETHINLLSMESATKYVADVRNILPGGKVDKSTNYLYFDYQKNQWTTLEIKQETKKAVKKDDNLIDKMSSFKIGVEKSAKVIKRDLILPYTEIIKNNDSKVIADYEIDDWDDEDPDDDLNI